MASNPIGACCAVAFKHDGKPQGKIETLNGVSSYIARPSENIKNGVGILFLTDIYGHTFENNQLLADQYAANGYLTIVPDILHDDPVAADMPAGFDIQAWFAGKAPHGKTPHTPDTVLPVVDKAIEWLRGEGGAKKIGAVGYCYGAKHAVIKQGEKKIDVVYVAHPSFVDEEELEKITGPLSIASAYEDNIFPPEKRHKSEEILQKTKQPFQITVYSHVSHGFAVRGDLSVPQVKFAKGQAFVQAVQWFDEYLK